MKSTNPSGVARAVVDFIHPTKIEGLIGFVWEVRFDWSRRRPGG